MSFPTIKMEDDEVPEANKIPQQQNNCNHCHSQFVHEQIITFCANCNLNTYCSDACMETDAPFHEPICFVWKLFLSTAFRPTPSFKNALYFPGDPFWSNVVFTTVDFKTEYWGGPEAPDFSFLMGVGNADIVQYPITDILEATYPTHRLFSTGNKIMMYMKKNTSDLPVNGDIMKLLGSKADDLEYVWRGPVVFLAHAGTSGGKSQQGLLEQFINISPPDLVSIIEYFLNFNDCELRENVKKLVKLMG